MNGAKEGERFAVTAQKKSSTYVMQILVFGQNIGIMFTLRQKNNKQFFNRAVAHARFKENA